MGLEEGARRAVVTCLKVRKGERVLILVDEERVKIGRALFDAVLDVGGEPLLTRMVTRTRHGEEPPRPVSVLMQEVDVVFAATTYSITHTRARMAANRAGTRIASMPGITEEMMSEGGMTADFEEMAKTMKRVARKVRGAREVTMTSALGTDITMSVARRNWVTEDTGLCHGRGETTNLPAGEIFIAPREGTAEGVLVVDGSFAEVLETPARVTVKEGHASRILGAKRAVEMLNKGGKDGRAVAEFGIGLNPKARIIGNILEDEKALGSVHVSFGDNASFGGKIQCGVHVDALVKDATVEIDGKTVVEEGKLLL
jgi:leucyl aminopeptidase (aminopeptidase T)